MIAQKFAHHIRKSLNTSTVIFAAMAKPDLRQIVAHNLQFFMRRPGCPYPNANALAVKAKIAPNTVRNLLDPRKRTTTTEKPDGYPTLDKLEVIAQVLTVEVWELLHPDIERALREREMYKKIAEEFEKLPQRTTTDEREASPVAPHP